MRAVIQRVSQSSVKVNGKILGQTSLGLLILLGIEEIDNRRCRLARKKSNRFTNLF